MSKILSWRAAAMAVLYICLVATTVVAFKSTAITRKSRTMSVKENTLDEMVIPRDLVPVSNSILVKVKEKPQTTKGGLYIPDEANARPTEGLVVATGPGRYHPETARLIEIAVKIGDKVLYGKYDGFELRYNKENHQLIKDDDVLLTYTGAEATIANVECVKDQVLVKLPINDQVTDSGIIMGKKEFMPGQKMGVGVVAKVGPGRIAGNGEYMGVQVKPGDNVRFREFAGFEIKIEGEAYNVIRCYDILSTWE
jgi:chaperonin GroES